jgi:hypothetical protein
LIAREQFDLCDLLTVTSQTVQISQVCTTGLGRQVRINGVGLGSRCGSLPIDRARIDWINRPSHFQQMRNQQAMGRLNDAGHLFFGPIANDLLQERIQFTQAFWIVIDTKSTYLTTLFINAASAS